MKLSTSADATAETAALSKSGSVYQAVKSMLDPEQLKVAASNLSYMMSASGAVSANLRNAKTESSESSLCYF